MPEPDYDYEAWSRDPGYYEGPGLHAPDTYKLPNHPTFSDESIYHGKDGAEGGHWSQAQDGSWDFTPGASNLQHHSMEELQDYFRRVEPGNRLNAPISESGHYPNETGRALRLIGRDPSTSGSMDVSRAISRLPFNQQEWDRFMREQPPSTHVEDRTVNDPTMSQAEKYQKMPLQWLIQEILR